MQRQLHDERGALAFLAFHADGAAVEEDELMHNAQAQARAALFAAAGLIYAIEAVEDVGQVFLGDAGAVVGHGEAGVPALALEGHPDHAAVLGILDGVFHQIINDLIQLGFVGIDIAGIGQGEQDLLAFLLGDGLEPVGVFLDELGDGQIFPGELHVLGVHLHQGQQIGDDGGQTVDFVVDVRHEFGAQVFVHVRLIDQGFDHDLHGGQGRFQLMAGVGHELVAALIQGFQLLAHGIESPGQLLHFAGTAHLHPAGEIALGHVLDASVQPGDGPGDHPGKDPGAQKGRRGDEHEDQDHLILQLVQVLHDFLHRAHQQQHPDDVRSVHHPGGAVAHPRAGGAAGKEQVTCVQGFALIQLVHAVICALAAHQNGGDFRVL